MGKIAVLNFSAGDCDRGFQPVDLEIREENQQLLGTFQGKLEPAPDIPQLYTRWQSRYRQMGYRLRLESQPGIITNFSARDLEADSLALKQKLNDWLQFPGFSPIIQGLLMNIQQNEEVRVIIKTENPHLRRLPWHLWWFFDRYLSAEVALSSPECQRHNPTHTRTKVRILAIIGDDTGIDLDGDRRELTAMLPEAEIVFVIKPEAKKVYQAIWDSQGWDILFFAGHSMSEPDATAGTLFIKDGQRLAMGDLTFGLRRAIAIRGLKLAIFNSCDGLGIAKQLADLNMPQVIVMREPVPDMVAQEFLKYFLEAFARGDSLYLAVREAREKLESVQREFPCATWLPVICQNPAEEPVSWQQLVAADEPEQTNTNPNRIPWRQIASQGLAVTAGAIVARQVAKQVWPPAGTVADLADDTLNGAQNIVNQNPDIERNNESTTDQK